MGCDTLMVVTKFKPNKNKATILPIIAPIKREKKNQIRKFKERFFTEEMSCLNFIVIQIEYNGLFFFVDVISTEAVQGRHHCLLIVNTKVKKKLIYGQKKSCTLLKGTA